jgi:hypothetical protein
MKYEEPDTNRSVRYDEGGAQLSWHEVTLGYNSSGNASNCTQQ